MYDIHKYKYIPQPTPRCIDCATPLGNVIRLMCVRRRAVEICVRLLYSFSSMRGFWDVCRASFAFSASHAPWRCCLVWVAAAFWLALVFLRRVYVWGPFGCARFTRRGRRICGRHVVITGVFGRPPKPTRQTENGTKGRNGPPIRLTGWVTWPCRRQISAMSAVGVSFLAYWKMRCVKRLRRPKMRPKIETKMR